MAGQAAPTNRGGDVPALSGYDPESPLPRAGLGRFAFGSFGMGIYVTVPGLLLLYYLTNVLDVDAWLAGLVLLLPKFVDVVVHPFIGSLSDMGRARRGDRVRMLMVGTATLPFAFILLFAAPPGLLGGSAALFVAVLFTLANTLFAAYQVPYLSLPSDLATGYNQRTRLMSWRMVVLTFGILIGGALAPLLAPQATAGRGQYLSMAVVLGAIMLVTMLVGVSGVRLLLRTVPQSPSGGAHTTGGVIGRFKVAWSNKPFFWLMCSYLFMSTTTHLLLAGTPFYTEYVMDNPKLTTVLFAAFVAPAIVATPLWAKISRSLGKQRCLLVAQSFCVVGSLLLLLGRPGGLVLVLPSMLLLGVAFAGMQLFPFSMLPDTVKAGGEDAQRNAGSFTGLWTATEATGAALGPYLYAATLAIGGFVSSQADETVTQTSTAITAVKIGFGLVPALVMVVAIILQTRYRLDDAARHAVDPATGGDRVATG